MPAASRPRKGAFLILPPSLFISKEYATLQCQVRFVVHERARRQLNSHSAALSLQELPLHVRPHAPQLSPLTLTHLSQSCLDIPPGTTSNRLPRKRSERPASTGVQEASARPSPPGVFPLLKLNAEAARLTVLTTSSLLSDSAARPRAAQAPNRACPCHPCPLSQRL